MLHCLPNTPGNKLLGAEGDQNATAGTQQARESVLMREPNCPRRYTERDKADWVCAAVAPKCARVWPAQTTRRAASVGYPSLEQGAAERRLQVSHVAVRAPAKIHRELFPE